MANKKTWYSIVGAKTPKALINAMDKVRKTKKLSRSAFIREAIKEKVMRIDPKAIDVETYLQQIVEGGIKK